MKKFKTLGPSCVDNYTLYGVSTIYSTTSFNRIPLYTDGRLKGTATLIISTFYKKELFKPWILIPVFSKSVEKWGSYGRLKNTIWPTLSRHFEYLISFQNFYNCLILSYLYHHTICVSEYV